MKKNNKGFSLVELIIVIAIMAILVGAIVPMLIMYIEKSEVSSDYQLADTVRSAIAYSIVDAKVVEDPASQPDLDRMENHGPISIDTLADNTVLKDSLIEYIGEDPSFLVGQVRSKHGAGCKCMVSTTNGVVKVTLTETDCTAKGDTSSGSTNNDISVE